MNCNFQLVHFNDVYNIGGAARFVTKIKSIQKDAKEKGRIPLVFFSGDALSPSTLSTVTNGDHMIPIFNAIDVDVACMGNHEFDFGADHLEKFVNKCTFPWLISNAIFKPTMQPLANGKVYVVLEREGYKIGVMGLVERAWLTKLATVDEADIIFEDFVDCGRRLAEKLRAEGCDLVVALTHMRMPNDERLARETGDLIDIILGGHDHHYVVKNVQVITVVKSGTDFRDFSTINISLSDTGQPALGEIIRQSITIDVIEDPDTKVIVDRYSKMLDSSLEKLLNLATIRIKKLKTAAKERAKEAAHKKIKNQKK
eukprot:GSMAST32.ASY1.ANO1.969.1 assembled CDS